MTSILLSRYDKLIESGDLHADAAQRGVIDELVRLESELGASGKPEKSGLLSRLFGSSERPETPKGVYIQGDVGRGKTMVMDLFFECVEVTNKQRSHFNDFMQDVHGRIHRIRAEQRQGLVWEDADPVEMAADEIAETSRLICFDEFQVTDITDAMILGRLFDALFGKGVVVVATSNVRPEYLYKDGLNRNAFEPFIARFQQQMVTVALQAERDYRIGRVAGEEVFLVPPGKKTDEQLQKLWALLTDETAGQPASITVRGRELKVPLAARGAAWFSFDNLCAEALGAADYIAIAAAYKTVVVENIPVMSAEQRNEARRFITLIDTLYDRRVRLVASAEAEPENLYPVGSHKFEFERTISRLTEMRSKDYWER